MNMEKLINLAAFVVKGQFKNALRQETGNKARKEKEKLQRHLKPRKLWCV